MIQGRVVKGELEQGPDGLWRPVEPQVTPGRRAGRAPGHTWTDDERLIASLGVSDTGLRARKDDAIAVRLRAVLPPSITWPALHQCFGSWQTALGFPGGWKTIPASIRTLAARSDRREAAEAELHRREALRAVEA